MLRFAIVQSIRARRTCLILAFGVVIAFISGTFAAAPASGQSAPFDPKISVELCKDGKFETTSNFFCEGDPKPGGISDVRLRIVQEAGQPLLNSGELRSEGFAVADGNTTPNNDKVGEGKVTINVVEPALGNVSPIICMVNQNPPDPGDHATVILIVNISSTQPCNPKSEPAPVLCGKLRIKGAGTSFRYTIDLGIGTGDTSAGGACTKGEASGVELKLATPLDVDVMFFGESKPNEDAKPPTSGGTRTVALPAEGGEYPWSATFGDASGTNVTREVRVVIATPEGEKKSSPLIPIVIVGGVILLAVIGYLLWSRSNRNRFEDWDYYDEEYGEYEEYEYSSSGGWQDEQGSYSRDYD